MSFGLRISTILAISSVMVNILARNSKTTGMAHLQLSFGKRKFFSFTEITIQKFLVQTVGNCQEEV